MSDWNDEALRLLAATQIAHVDPVAMVAEKLRSVAHAERERCATRARRCMEYFAMSKKADDKIKALGCGHVVAAIEALGDD